MLLAFYWKKIENGDVTIHTELNLFKDEGGGSFCDKENNSEKTDRLWMSKRQLTYTYGPTFSHVVNTY